MIELRIAKLTLSFNIQNHIIINWLVMINILYERFHKGYLFISDFTLRTFFNMDDFLFGFISVF